MKAGLAKGVASTKLSTSLMMCGEIKHIWAFHKFFQMVGFW